MTKERKQELTLRITQANKSELVNILYEMLEIYIEEAKEALSIEDDRSFHESIRKCTGCVRELVSSVNERNPVAKNLFSLYVFCNKELAKSDLHKSADELHHVDSVIRKLHAANIEVARKDTSASVMGNTQSVYAGLTYGKESLVVQLNSESNRGYTV